MFNYLRIFNLSLFPLILFGVTSVIMSFTSSPNEWFNIFYPFGFILALINYNFFQNQFVIDLSSKWNRRVHFFSFFAITVLPLLQFAKTREVAWIFFAYFPFFHELISHIGNESKWVKEKKTVIFQFFVVTSLLVTLNLIFLWQESFSKKATIEDFISELSLVLFSVPIFLYLKSREENRHLKLTKKFLFESNNEIRDSLNFTGSLKEQKFFYHDLINKTHGMNLFLSEKLRQGPSSGINFQDLVMLQKEIYSLQTMIKDHSEINHRNLAPMREWMSFLEFRPKIGHLARTYFSHKQVILQENYSKIDGELQSFMVHSPSFERALGNLFKNAYEANSSKIEIIINISERELVLEMKNDLQQIPETSFQMADRLSRNIAKVDEHEEGPIGLESIHFLIERMNGKFTFGKEADMWVSRLVIPNSKVENLERGIKPKDSFGKRAA